MISLVGAVAQLGERYNGIVEVVGSIPSSSTKSHEETAKIELRISVIFFMRQTEISFWRDLVMIVLFQRIF